MLSPSHAPADLEVLTKLGAALKAETGLAVEVTVAATPEKAIEAFGSAQADVGLLSPTEFLFTRSEYGVRARLQVERAAHAHDYVGEIFVRADGGAATIAELAGEKVAYANPLSTSGFLLPAALLADAGVDVEAVFAGGHAEAIAALKAGDVAAAASYHGAGAKEPTLKVLAKTVAIPNEPIFVRDDLAEDKAKAIVAALTKLAGTPEGKALLRPLADIEGLIAIDDAAYDALLVQVQKAGVSVADLVPSGRTISWSNNPILGPE